MASKDDFDLDWDDPFGGDFDLDMDFDMDPFANKGFIGGATSGFLSGLVDETVGSSSARMRTLRTVLPSSFSNALDKVSWASEKLDEIKEDFQKQNVESVKYLQNIAGKLSTKMEGKLPGFVSEGMSEFSQKDFSHWEDSSSSNRDSMPEMDRENNYDVDAAISNSMESQSSMFSALGQTLNEMSATVGGMLNGSMMAGNRQLVGIESSIRSLVDYQRNVQYKMDQSKINLMARSYVADIKYYKFMEKALHTEVTELKKIVINSGKSDYEKTSHFTAGKAYARNKLFSTIGDRKGGLTGLMREKFGKSARNEAYTETNFLLSSIVDMMEMSEDMPLSKGMFGDIIGRNVAEGVINNLPYFFERGAGKGWIEKLAEKNPEQAKRLSEGYGKLTNIGNRSSYAANNMTGLINILAENWESLDEMPYLDYQDYLDNFKGEGEPLSKARWTVQNAVTNRGKSSINQFMSEMTKAKGTQYTLSKRNVKDLNQPGIWKEMNNITLNEVLPGLLSSIHQSVEGLRTGEMKDQISYSYMRGQFMDQGNKAISVQADLMPYSDFSRFSSAALEMVDSFDPEKRLSQDTRKAFAQAIARDVDKEKGFSPFLYVGEIPGVSPTASKEINALMKRHFNVTDESIDRFKNGSAIDKMRVMTDMGSEEANVRLNKAGAAAANLKTLFPNVAERIDLLRSTGNEQMLRDLGVIYTENGADKVNMEIFHERIGQFMDNPNNPILKGGINRGDGPAPTSFVLPKGPKTPSGGSGGTLGIKGLEELNESISGLSGVLKENDFSQRASPLPSFEKLESSLAGIAGNTTGIETLMTRLVDLAEKGQILTGAKTVNEERAEEKATSSFMSKIKGLLPTNLLGRGMDILMKNQPMVLGSLIGTLGASFVENPLLAAATIAGGALVGGMYQHFSRTAAQMGGGQEPNDDEDILDENGETILESAKLKAGHYFDAITKRIIKTWRDIRGPIFDAVTKATIGVKDLAKKIFGPDGREVVLSGLTKAKELAIGAYNFVDPVEKMKAFAQFGKELIYQQNVYVKSNTKRPRLTATGFKNHEYWKDNNGKFEPVMGWNEIDGAVYNEDGDEVITQQEFEDGLVTETGQVIRNTGAGASKLMSSGLGIAKKLADSLLGRFGYSSEETPEGQGKRSPGASGGVERRLDKIYALLSKQFGISVNDEEADELAEGGVRLNSFADKQNKAKEKDRADTSNAIKDIASALKGGDEKEPEEKKGIFGKLMGLLGGMGGFITNLIKNPIGTIGGALVGTLTASAGRLAKIGSMLFSGVLGIASPIMKMLKWGFTSLGSVLTGGKMLSAAGDLAGAAGDIPGTGGGRGKPGGKVPRGKPGMFGRLGRAIGGLGMPGKILGGAMLAGGTMYGMDAFGSDEPVQQDNEGEFYRPQRTAQEDAYALRQAERAKRDEENTSSMTPAEMAASFYLPTSVAMMAGQALGLYETGSKEIVSDDGKRFLSVEDRNRYEDERDGVVAPVSLTRDPAKSFSLQKQIRYAQYGLNKVDSPLAIKIDELEQWLIPYVVIRGNRASLRDDVPVMKMIKQFGASLGPELQDQVKTWFVARFKSVFLLYNAATSIGRFGDLNDFDSNSNWESLQVCERLQGSLVTMDPNPLSIQVQISPDTPIMTEIQTQRRVNELLTEMRKERKKPEADLTLLTAEESRSKALGENEPKKTGVAGFFQDLLGDSSAKMYQEQIDKKFKSPEEVKQIDISDMHKNNDTPIDPFTFARLAAYGNVDNMPWRVDAVLRLERYCEALIDSTGSEMKFSGSASRVLELFKPMFRIEKPLAEGNWMDWFNNRFLPILKRYVQLVHELRNAKPAKAWQALSATNKVEVARELTSVRVEKDGEDISVWEVEASPFPSSKSGTVSGRAERYLTMLDSKASEARLKDPDLEEQKSKSVKTQALQDSVQKKQRTDAINSAFNRAWGTQRQASAGNVGVGGGGSGMSFGAGGMPNAYGQQGSNWSDMGPGGQFEGGYNSNYNPEILKKAGEDNGVKLSLQDGERLMLNTMLKHGITDKKQLALGLAMARKETGDYQNTVENTNWSAPTLKKYFRNIPDMATAQKVAAMPAPERAMYVYGRAPKGPTLGNEKPEDGWLYRGRGFFQLTGKDNYKRLANELDVDVVKNPELVSEDPKIMAESAVRFLKSNKAMMDIGKTGNFETAARGINGGNAVPDTDTRRKFYQDYLNKLNNGDIQVPVGDVSADPYGAQPDPIPSAADQNVEPSKISGENQSSKKAQVDNALNAADSTKTIQEPKPATTGPSNGLGSPTRTETERVQEVKQTAQKQKATEKAASDTTTTKTPTVQLPQPVPPVKPKDITTTVTLPKGTIDVSDEGVKQLLGQAVGLLDMINGHLSSKTAPGVNTN